MHTVRKALGHQLAREHPVSADIVVPVPDSGVSAALGFAEESGTAYEMGLIRNHYVGRTFIEPKQGIRHFGVKVKLNPMRATLEGRRVVVVDDSIVRGTTSRKIVRMIRGAGARVHADLLASDPVASGWHRYAHAKELIAAATTRQSLRYLGADSLGCSQRRDVEGHRGDQALLHACFTGDAGGYRTPGAPQLTCLSRRGMSGRRARRGPRHR